MILQSLSKAIREQNYYAVALEFIIVIAGVVIGFQIQDWNEGRSERAREAEYLLRLDAEMTAVVEDFDSATSALDAYFNWITLFFEGVREGDPAKAQQGSWGLNAITDVEIITIEPAALREMISAGDLKLIQNAELRSDLASVTQLQGRSHASLHQMASDLTPVAFEISAHFQARLEDVTEFSEVRYTDQTIQFDFDAVSQNEALLGRINYAALQNRFQAALLARDRSEIEAIRQRVRDEIDARELR